MKNKNINNIGNEIKTENDKLDKLSKLETVNKLNASMLEEKIVDILNKNNIKPILSGNHLLIATIRIYEENKLDVILSELESLFNNYKSYEISSSHISSCCAPSYDEIRYKIEF